MKLSILINVACLLLPISLVVAATSDFTVRTLVGDDTTPPSIPTSPIATPVATSQINLTWASSTDDYILSGYHVWRDDVQIATTTTTAYSDTGLIQGTLYTYYVTAFDSFNNISASSTIVATTTLSPPPPTPTTTSSGSQGTWFRPLSEEIISIEVLPQKDSVIIRYETEGYVRSVIKWGRSTSYELGSLAEQAFSKFHETKIVGLTPNVRYYFTIEGENKIGRYGTMYEGTFTTLPPEDIFPPGNVTGLTAVRDGDDILLSWTNPTDPDLAKVRVVRNDQFYPSDIADGWVVYEDTGTGVRDRGSATTAQKQYYTVFTYDELGNISSGAVVSIYLGDETIPQGNDMNPALNPIALSFDDFEFSQEGIAKQVVNGEVSIDGSKQLAIALPYDRVPEHLKTILVVIGDSRNNARTFTFLLRVNKEKTGYTSILAPFGSSGNFPIQISVFDFKTTQVGYTQGTLVSHIRPIHTEPEVVGFLGGIISFISFIGHSYVLWFILLLILLMFISRRLMHTQW